VIARTATPPPPPQPTARTEPKPEPEPEPEAAPDDGAKPEVPSGDDADAALDMLGRDEI
jgi:hypothetical protein